MKDRSSCPHNNFGYSAKLIEFFPQNKKPATRPMLMLAVQANCEDCGEPFVFHDMEVLSDLPEGTLRYCSHVSPDGQTVFHPIAVVSDCKLIKESLN